MKEFCNNALFVPAVCYMIIDKENFNGEYHYSGRADTFFHIGQVMGRAYVTGKRTRRDLCRGDAMIHPLNTDLPFENSIDAGFKACHFCKAKAKMTVREYIPGYDLPMPMQAITGSKNRQTCILRCAVPVTKSGSASQF